MLLAVIKMAMMIANFFIMVLLLKPANCDITLLLSVSVSGA